MGLLGRAGANAAYYHYRVRKRLSNSRQPDTPRPHTLRTGIGVVLLALVFLGLAALLSRGGSFLELTAVVVGIWGVILLVRRIWEVVTARRSSL